MTGHPHSLIPNKPLQNTSLDFIFCAHMGRLNMIFDEVFKEKKSLEVMYQSLATNLFSNAKLQMI